MRIRRRRTDSSESKDSDHGLFTAVGLISAAMLLTIGTVIVLILSNARPLVRSWPADSGSWDVGSSGYVSSGEKLGHGYSHSHCEFDKSNYSVSTGSGRTPWIDPFLYPAEDEESGADDEWTPEEHLTPDPAVLEDEAIDDSEEKDPDSFDNGLAIIRVDPFTESDSVLEGWNEQLGAEGVIRNIPDTTKPVPRVPFPKLSKMPVTFIAWNETTDSFESHDLFTANAELTSAGFFGPENRPKPLVLVVHGWHGAYNDSQFLLAGVRLYSRAVPEAAVLYVDWEQQGAVRTPNNATLLAWRVNVTNFINGLSKNTDLHCIGHSIGTFSCASICRQYYAYSSKRCSRIVAISPYEILELVPELTQRIRDRTYRKDAEYVAVLTGSTRLMATAESEGDEYIVFNNLAYTSEVCDAEDDWGVDVCATDGNGKKHCEYFSVHNVTYITVPTDKKRYCSSMLPLIYYFSALEPSSGMPLIRSNPMATSTLVGMLPSVWDARIYSKDYRFSSFVRNDSVWYSANYGHTDTGVSPTQVFTVVVPYVSRASIYGSVGYVAKTRYHNISVYSAFVRGEANERDPPVITVLTPGPILSAYLYDSGSGFAALQYSSFDTISVPSTAQKFTKYECAQKGANYSCTATSVKSSVVVPRRRIPVNGLSLPVPIAECIPYSPPNVDLLVWKRVGMTMSTGVNITVTYSHSRQLMAVILENHERPSNTTLFTFYNTCESSGQAGMYFDYDWGKAEMKMAFVIPGRYTMRWYFLFEVLEVPITAIDKAGNYYGRRTLDDIRFTV